MTNRPTKPAQPWSLCRHPGCRELHRNSGGYCDDHRKTPQMIHDARRGNSASRGYARQHQQWRKLILHRDPICKACGKALATEADHITPLSQGGGWSLTNGQGLCKPCHARKTASDQREKRSYGGYGGKK